MKTRTVTLQMLILLTAWWFPGPATGAGIGAATTQTTQAFLSAATHYSQGAYQQAAEKFESIAAEGVVNATLFYNLANAYLKTGDLGRAILWYERAIELTPRDPDLKFNYATATSMLKDEGGQSGTIYRILFFWKYQLGRSEIMWAAVAFNTIFWLILGARILLSKRPLNIATLVVLLAALVFTGTAASNFYEDRHPRRAVILAARTPVRSGRAPEATELFVLHAGTRVRVDEDSGQYVKIYFAPGKIGWVRKADVETI